MDTKGVLFLQEKIFSLTLEIVSVCQLGFEKSRLAWYEV